MASHRFQTSFWPELSAWSLACPTCFTMINSPIGLGWKQHIFYSAKERLPLKKSSLCLFLICIHLVAAIFLSCNQKALLKDNSKHNHQHHQSCACYGAKWHTHTYTIYRGKSYSFFNFCFVLVVIFILLLRNRKASYHSDCAVMIYWGKEWVANRKNRKLCLQTMKNLSKNGVSFLTLSVLSLLRVV